MVKRFRKFESAGLAEGRLTARKLIIAVTANGQDFEASPGEGFDEICGKPLGRADINRIVLERFGEFSFM